MIIGEEPSRTLYLKGDIDDNNTTIIIERIKQIEKYDEELKIIFKKKYNVKSISTNYR